MEEKDIVGLRGSHLVEKDLVDLILRRSLAPLLGGVIGAVIETVGAPGDSGELGPLDVVGEEPPRCHFADEDLLPVAAGARDDVSHVLAVVRERDILERHGAIVRELIGVKEYAAWRSERIHLIKDALILEPVIGVDVPFAASFKGHADAFVVSHLAEPLENLGALRHLGQISTSEGVLGLDPCGGLGTRVVLERAERVGHALAKIDIDSAVGRRGGIFETLPRRRHGGEKRR